MLSTLMWQRRIKYFKLNLVAEIYAQSCFIEVKTAVDICSHFYVLIENRYFKKCIFMIYLTVLTRK